MKIECMEIEFLRMRHGFEEGIGNNELISDYFETEVSWSLVSFRLESQIR